MKRIAILIALAELAGCNSMRCATKQNPVDVHIAPECRVKCSIKVALITADPNSIVTAAKDALSKCDARRALCDAALQRGQDAGAIK